MASGPNTKYGMSNEACWIGFPNVFFNERFFLRKEGVTI
jgi:hypothetical protein